MKAIILKNHFIKAVNAVSRLTSTRSTLPILQNVYIGADKGELVVRATDLEQTIEVIIEAEVQDAGAITIPLRILVDFLSNNSDERVTLTTDDLSITVKSSNHQVKMKGLPAEDYPTSQKVKFDFELELNSQLLNQAITDCLFASANDDTRPILTGLLFDFTKDGLVVVGTDGYRLAKFQTEAKGQVGQFIVPKRSLAELQRLLDEGTVKLGIGNSQIQFSINKTILISRLIDGKFPNYQTIIPNDKKLIVTGSGPALLGALKVASLFSRDSAYSTKLNINGDKIEVVAISPQLGESRSEVAVKNEQDSNFSISLNSQYMIDVLNAVSGDFILEFNSESSPIVAKFPTLPKYLYLVMPLRSE